MISKIKLTKYLLNYLTTKCIWQHIVTGDSSGGTAKGAGTDDGASESGTAKSAR